MKYLISILDHLILLVFMVLGIFCAIGVCVSFWGTEGLNVLSESLNSIHPASFTFFLTMPIFMLTSAFAAIFGIIVPIHIFLKLPFNKDNSMLSTIEAYSILLKKILEINKDAYPK